MWPWRFASPRFSGSGCLNFDTSLGCNKLCIHGLDVACIAWDPQQLFPSCSSIPMDSSSPDHSDAGARSRTGPRIAIKQACDLCRKKKLKCDGARPCSSCRRFKTECEHLLARGRSGPKRGHLKAIHERLGTHCSPPSRILLVADSYIAQMESMLDVRNIRKSQTLCPCSISSQD